MPSKRPRSKKGKGSAARKQARRNRTPKFAPCDWEGAEITDKDRLFLTALANTGRMTIACSAAGVRYGWHKERARHSNDFATALRDARDAAVDLVLEDRAFQVADAGNVPMLIELLRAHRPSVYRPSWDPASGGTEEHRKLIEITVTADTLNMHLPAQSRPGPFDHLRAQIPQPTFADQVEKLIGQNGQNGTNGQNGHH